MGDKGYVEALKNGAQEANLSHLSPAPDLGEVAKACHDCVRQGLEKPVQRGR